MSASRNLVILIGNLGQDPETKTTGSGSVVARLSIASNERVKDGDDWKDHTEWHRVVCFGKVAENAARYLQKGRQVYIEGKLRTNKWQDKDGVDRYTTEIIADTVQFLGGAPEGGGARGGRGDDRSSGSRGGDGGGGRSGGSRGGDSW